MSKNYKLLWKNFEYQNLLHHYKFTSFTQVDELLEGNPDTEFFAIIPFEALTNTEPNGLYVPANDEFIPQNFIEIYEFEGKKIANTHTSQNTDKLLTKWMSSAYTDTEHAQKVEQIRDSIYHGDFFQTNLTRKFYGEFHPSTDTHYLDLFYHTKALTNPLYACFASLPNYMILSFSPEKFLTRDGNMLTSSPIKGTLKRHENSQIDAQNIDVFQADIKNCAENTMIVDLTRNDFNKICNTGTVKVPSLCRLMSLPNVHHLVSDIQGDLPKNTRFSDIFTAIFPPPSMTGAPKILATQTAIKLEGIKRGFYSGAMGILSHNYFDFSVIIRTLILQNNRFEFQSGGGITYLSNPHEEVAEMYNKINFLKSIINI